MNCVVEERVNSMQSENALMQDTKKAMVKNKARTKLNSDEPKSSITELFPWILEFRKMYRCIHTEKSMASLTELMQFYARNVNVSVNECYTRPLRAAKLKESISESLLLFLYIYRELSEGRDRSVYLNNMSDLLALYIDMELKASKKSKEDHEKICARLTSCLCVYLEHSIEHLLDTLIKIQFMCRNYQHILDPVITKIMKSIPTHPESSTMYIRYFLIYRLWRKVNENAAVKSQITANAIASLGPLPSTFSSNILADVLPKVPKSQPNSTKTLLQHKFDIKKHCEMFIRYCRKTNESVCQRDGPTTLIDSSSRIISKMPEDTNNKGVDHLDNKTTSLISDKSNQNGSISLRKTFKPLNFEEQNSFERLDTSSSNVSAKHISPKSIQSNRNTPRRKCRKSNEIVVIDLTSDTVLEKCIKKRTSRKLSWLKEAKKRVDMKMVKSSQKKTRREQEDTNRTHRSDTSRSIDRHSEDASQSEYSAGNISGKYESNAFRTVAAKNDENKMEITEEVVACEENGRISVGTEVNSKEISIKFSTVTSKPVLTEILPSEHEVSNIFDRAVNDNCLHNEDISNTQSDEKENNRFNKQTVIKRLIETDNFSEPEARGRVESFGKACDLKAEYPSVNSSTTCTQYDSKDNPVNSNRSNVNATNGELTECTTSSEINVESERDNPNVSSDATSNNVCFGETTVSRSECCVDTANSDVVCQKLTAAQGNDKSVAKTFAEAARTVETSSVADNLDEAREQRSSPEFVERSMIRQNVESRVKSKSSERTSAAMNAGQNDLCERATLEIRNNQEVKNDTGIADTGESIFESRSTDKENISDAANAVTCPNENVEINEDRPCIDTNLRNPAGDTIDDKRDDNSDVYVNKENVPRERSEVPGVPPGITSKELCNASLNITDEKNVCNVIENKFLVQDSDLQDNIDGLSLLASVSQHVPHLKPDSEVKHEQIKVKDYASLRYTCYNQITDDEADTNDSSNTVSHLLENPSTEIINRIVGIYPEDGQSSNKVALRVEVTSNDTDSGNRDGELYNVVSHPEASINYDADNPSHNLTPVESNVQSVKENTNVILNGETVVLLQKSPNSNLYIINKAVENSKDHNSDEEMARLKEKNWVSVAEECGQFEAAASLDHTSYNAELTSYSKELSSYPDAKCSVARGKGIKVELEDNNFADSKAYSKKVPMPTDILSVNSQMYQDANVIGKSMDKRKSPKSSLAYRQNIKQEFNGIPNHIASNCAIPGCNGIHSHPHEVDAQHPLHIPPAHPTTLPSIYGNCAGNADLCVPYHKHCTSVPCSLQINAGTSLHSHPKAGSPCGRSHCSCLNCTYDIVAHCRQCIHPSTDTHVSCIESSPYFLPTHSSVQSPAVQEHDRAKSDAVIGKLYDDQLLCKIEKSLLQNSPLEKLDVQCSAEKMYNKDAENKLPLKKRLKAHAMAYREMSIKAEKVDNYPAMPMMSIAALEVLDGNTQKRSGQIVKSEYELSSSKKNDSHDGYHYGGSNLVRRDYYKDVHVTGSHQNIAKDSARKVERQYRSTNEQSGNTVYQESCLQRTVKTAAQRKEIGMSNVTLLTDVEVEPMGQEGTYKKVKKTQSPPRQTRSSKRNVPKVNYSYTDVDPEWNPSGEPKRKRRKTSR